MGTRRDTKIILDNVKLAQNEQYKVCIWGAGNFGKTIGYDILKKLNIKLDYYCDNNEILWGKEIREGIICVDYHQLLNDRDKIVWLLCIGEVVIKDIIEQLAKMEMYNYVTLTEIISMPEVVHKFFPFMEKRTVAYTCIVGDYDKLEEPDNSIKEQYDYYLISDKRPQEGSVYQWINIKDVVPSAVSDFTRMNRYCKINAHKIFPMYKRSIYYDGNISLKHSLDFCFEKLYKTRIAVASPLEWNVYEEAVRLLPQMRDEPERIYAQVEKYWNAGMPEGFGSCWCNVLVREHNNPVCIELMEEWWNEVETQSKRDQLSFPYILWKNGYSTDDVLMISNKSSECPYWKYVLEHKVSRLVNVK